MHRHLSNNLRVCTGVHALASVYAIEDAIGIKVPDNANIIRNIMLATLWCHDHLVHFYQLAGMDWIDVLNALKADPRATSQLAQSLSAAEVFSGLLFDVQNRLKKFVDGGQLGFSAAVIGVIGSTNCRQRLT